MKLDNTIVVALKAAYPTHSINLENVEALVKSRNINIASLIESNNTYMHYTGPAKTKRLAYVLNVILLKNFDSLQEFYDTLGISCQWYTDLWAGKIKTIQKQIIVELITCWQLNPLDLLDIPINNRKK